MCTRESRVLPHENALLWTRLRCSGCRYMSEVTGPLTLEDLARAQGVQGSGDVVANGSTQS